jgi:hypothetical protein
VNAKLEEQKKIGEGVVLGFNLFITTKPNVVRYSTAGSVTLEGKQADVKKKLELNTKTKIPQVLFTVYQHVFNSIYMLSSILNTPYPPPDLLHPMAEKIQIIQTPAQHEKNEAPAPSSAQPPASTVPQPSEKPATT